LHNIMKKGSLILPALGRAFEVGMLYDARKDQMLAGRFLWAQSDFKKFVIKRDRKFADNDYREINDISDRKDLLNVKGEIALSFMAGLVKVRGSAEYLHDSRSSSIRETFTGYRNVLTHTEHLPLADIMKSDVKVVDKVLELKDATHIVTMIEYGGDVIVEFSCTKNQFQDKKNVSGSLKVLIEAIPNLNIDAKASIKADTAELKTYKKIEFKVKGNCLPSDLPRDILGAYNLLNNTKIDRQGAVPMIVHLTPITSAITSFEIMVRNINESVLLKLNEYLDLLNRVLSSYRDFDLITTKNSCRLKDLLPLFFDNIKAHGEALKVFNAFITGKLLTILPQVRITGDHKELNKLLGFIARSPLNKENIERYFDSVTRIITVMQTFALEHDGDKANVRLLTSLQKETSLPFQRIHRYFFTQIQLGVHDPLVESIRNFSSSWEQEYQRKAGQVKKYEFPEVKHNGVGEVLAKFNKFRKANENNSEAVPYFMVISESKNDPSGSMQAQLGYVEDSKLKNSFDTPTPTNIQLSKLNDKIKVEWNLPTDQEIPTETRYEVQFRQKYRAVDKLRDVVREVASNNSSEENGNGTHFESKNEQKPSQESKMWSGWKTMKTKNNVTSLTVRGFTKARNFQVRIRCVSPAGHSDWSRTVDFGRIQGWTLVWDYDVEEGSKKVDRRKELCKLLKDRILTLECKREYVSKFNRSYCIYTKNTEIKTINGKTYYFGVFKHRENDEYGTAVDWGTQGDLSGTKFRCDKKFLHKMYKHGKSYRTGTETVGRSTLMSVDGQKYVATIHPSGGFYNNKPIYGGGLYDGLKECSSIGCAKDTTFAVKGTAGEDISAQGFCSSIPCKRVKIWIRNLSLASTEIEPSLFME